MATDPQAAARSRTGRPLSLVIGALAVLGVTAFLLYRSGQFERWFASDTDNAEELDRLRGDPPSLPPPAAAEAGWPQWLGPLRDGRAPAGLPNGLRHFQRMVGFRIYRVRGSVVPVGASLYDDAAVPEIPRPRSAPSSVSEVVR